MKFKEVVSIFVLVTSAKSCITQVRLVYSVPNLENPFRQVCDTGRDLMLDSCRLIFERSHFERSENEFFRSRFSHL